MPELTRRFLWTVVPSGRVNGNNASFSVLLTPKLLAPRDTTVKAFAMQSWPKRLDAMRFFGVRNGTRFDITRVTKIVDDDNTSVQLTITQRMAIWQAIFPGVLEVRAPSQPGYDGRDPRQFPAHEVGAEVKSAYTRTATALTNLSTEQSIFGDDRWAPLYDIAKDWQAAATSVGAVLAGLSPASPPLQLAYEFYHRSAETFSPLDEADLAPPKPDFHDKVVRLADHPILLRALGLLIDFEVPVAKLTGTPPGGARDLGLQLEWSDPLPAEGWSTAAQQDVLPRTSYSIAGTRFVPLSPSGSQPAPQGLLPLAGVGEAGVDDDARFEVMPFDVDGAALRMFSVAASEQGNIAQSAVATAGLPTLRSMGLALVDRTRAQRHVVQMQRARSLTADADLADAALTADDLTAGYRVDIYDERTGQWHPLCRRRVNYTVGGVTIGPAPGLVDEGLVHADSATTGSGNTDTLYIHQVLFRWDGWSLVLPRPDRPAEPLTSPRPEFTVALDQIPGVLPRLRFGRKYRLRARLVSLGGAGLRSGDLGATEQQSALVKHRRFEPVLAPELAPTRRYVDHERHDRMVIRSDRGVTVAAYSDRTGYPPIDLRYLFAPKSSLELAMQHEVKPPTSSTPFGHFDSAIGKNASPAEVAKQFEIAKRADNDLTSIPGVELVDGGGDAGKYFVVPADHNRVTLPWLPDVAADIVGMRVAPGGRPITEKGVPGATQGFLAPSDGTEKFIVDWRGSWPNLVPIALRVQDADSTVDTGCIASAAENPANRAQLTFTVALAPAEQVTVDLYSVSKNIHIANFGVAVWAGASEYNADDRVVAAIRRGRNPLVTPLRSVTMVHAVQRPLKDPSGALTATRVMGQTSVVLNAHPPDPARDPFLNVHMPSTGRIDVSATWTDLEDVPPNRPIRKPVAANVGSYDVAHKPSKIAPPNGAFPVIRQEFGDTRRRKVTYTVDATSRFRDYFGKILAGTPNACTVRGVLDECDILSGTRPPAPKIRNIVPAFGWRKSSGGGTFRSSRLGGKLRVMLERPWFVTGAEEELAVLAWPQGAGQPTTAQQRHLSLAGRDPIWTNGSSTPATFPSVLSPAQFAQGTPSMTTRLTELGGNVTAMISRLSWPTSFDSDADCWFADVDLGPLVAATYFPFVRLALCRFQAGTAECSQRLSSPILTEPLQLFPHRDLTVKRTATNVAVVVSDPDNLQPERTSIRAELQTFTGDPRAAADALIGDSGWRTVQNTDGTVGDSLNLPLQGVGGQALRVVATETETYQNSGSRIVYADTIALQ